MSMIAQFKSYKPCGMCKSDNEEIKDWFYDIWNINVYKKIKHVLWTCVKTIIMNARGDWMFKLPLSIDLNDVETL